MAIPPFKPVTFTEGEPLDANKLNELQTNIATIYGQSAVLTNSLTNSQNQATVPIMDGGSYTFTNGTGSNAWADSTAIQFSAAFSGDPIFVVSVVSDASGIVTTARGNISSGRGFIHVATNKPTTAPIVVNWIAFQNKTL